MKRKVTSFLSKYLSLFGFPANTTTNGYRHMVCSTLIASSTILCTMATFQVNSTELYDFIKPINLAIVGMLVLVPVLMTASQIRNIRSLIIQIDENIYNYPDESEITPQYDRLYDESNLITIFVSLQCVNFCASLLMIVLPLVQRFVFGKVDMIIFPTWTPWSINQLIPFIVIFIQHAATVLVAIPWYSFALILPLAVMVEYKRQCKRMNTALCTIEERVLNSVRTRKKKNNTLNFYDVRNKYSNNVYDGEFKQSLVSCINHYQTLLRTFHLFQPWWSLMFSSQLILNVVNFALSFYCIFETRELEVIVTINITLWSTFAVLLTFCYIGEEFLNMVPNEQITNAIFYEIQWYRQPRKIRRLLLIFHMLIITHPFELNGLSIFQASYRTFTYLCRTSYSYLNVLKVSTRKN